MKIFLLFSLNGVLVVEYKYVWSKIRGYKGREIFGIKKDYNNYVYYYGDEKEDI